MSEITQKDRNNISKNIESLIKDCRAAIKKENLSVRQQILIESLVKEASSIKKALTKAESDKELAILSVRAMVLGLKALKL